MWIYEKRLEYPVNIKRCNAQLAKMIITQYGGPDSNIYNSTYKAEIRYLYSIEIVFSAL